MPLVVPIPPWSTRFFGFGWFQIRFEDCGNGSVLRTSVPKLMVNSGGFHEWGYPKAGWFLRENPICMDDNRKI